MSLVNQERLNYFAQQLYAKIKANFDSKDSAVTAETNAKEYADGLNTAMDGRVGNLETTVGDTDSGLVKDVAILKGDETTEGSVAYQIAQIVAGADANYDTLKEIADWIKSDTTGAAKMVNDIQANAEAIADLEALVGTIPEEATATDIVGYIAEYVQAQLEAGLGTIKDTHIDLEANNKYNAETGNIELYLNDKNEVYQQITTKNIKSAGSEYKVYFPLSTDAIFNSDITYYSIDDSSNITTKSITSSNFNAEIEAGLYIYIGLFRNYYILDSVENLIKSYPNTTFYYKKYSDFTDPTGTKRYILSSNDTSTKITRVYTLSYEPTKIEVPLTELQEAITAINILNGDDQTEGSVAKSVTDGIAEAKAYTDEKDTAMSTRVDDIEANMKPYVESVIYTQVSQDATYDSNTSYYENKGEGFYRLVPDSELNITTDDTTVFDNMVTSGVLYTKDTNKLSDANTDDEVPTAKLVYESITDAVAQATESISKGGDLVNNVISTKAGTVTVTKGENTQDVAIKGVVVNPTYDNTTRTITLPYADGTDSLVISLGKDIFVDSDADNKYNAETGNIELFLNDGKEELELVNITSMVKKINGTNYITVSKDNNITYSSTATYYELDSNGTDVQVATVNDSNFDDKVATGLYIKFTDFYAEIQSSISNGLNDVYGFKNMYANIGHTDADNNIIIDSTVPLSQSAGHPSVGETVDYAIYITTQTQTMISIPASSLVDIYTGATSADGSTTVSVSADNVITTSVNVSAEDGNKLEKKADGLYVDAVTQADFDTLDEQVNGEDGIVARLTNAESNINDNTNAIEQLRSDVDSTIANLSDVHVDATDENKYDNTTGNINLYLNDGKETYEEIKNIYDGENWYKLGPNATYSNDIMYAVANELEDSITDRNISVTTDDFAEKVATGLWVYRRESLRKCYPNVNSIKIIDADGISTVYSVGEEYEGHTYQNLADLISYAVPDGTTFYLLVKDEPTKIEVPITELKTAIENIATNSEAIGVETDTENGITATGIYARLEMLETGVGTPSVKDESGNVTTPATGIYAEIEAAQNNLITESEIDGIIAGLE